jgi:hypothetical protein
MVVRWGLGVTEFGARACHYSENSHLPHRDCNTPLLGLGGRSQSTLIEMGLSERYHLAIHLQIRGGINRRGVRFQRLSGVHGAGAHIRLHL